MKKNRIWISLLLGLMLVMGMTVQARAGLTSSPLGLIGTLPAHMLLL